MSVIYIVKRIFFAEVYAIVNRYCRCKRIPWKLVGVLGGTNLICTIATGAILWMGTGSFTQDDAALAFGLIGSAFKSEFPSFRSGYALSVG